MAYTREFPCWGHWDHFKCKFLISTYQSITYHPTPPKNTPRPPQKNILLSSGFLSLSYYYLFQILTIAFVSHPEGIFNFLLLVRVNKIPDV